MSNVAESLSAEPGQLCKNGDHYPKSFFMLLPLECFNRWWAGMSYCLSFLEAWGKCRTVLWCSSFSTCGVPLRSSGQKTCGCNCCSICICIIWHKFDHLLHRYPFYMLACIGLEWRVLTWLRYTCWALLYPLGTVAEGKKTLAPCNPLVTCLHAGPL